MTFEACSPNVECAAISYVELSDLPAQGHKVILRWEAYNKDGNLSAGGTEALQIRNGKIILRESLP